MLWRLGYPVKLTIEFFQGGWFQLIGPACTKKFEANTPNYLPHECCTQYVLNIEVLA